MSQQFLAQLQNNALAQANDYYSRFEPGRCALGQGGLSGSLRNQYLLAETTYDTMQRDFAAHLKDWDK